MPVSSSRPSVQQVGVVILLPRPLGEGSGVRELPKLPLPPELLQRRRELRRNATDAEQLLWGLLRGCQLGRAKFRRQHPLGRFVLDFYCHEALLAVELDGGGHAEPGQARYDTDRTQALQAEGVRVLRFWNHEMLQDPEAVLEVILGTVTAAPSPPAPLPEGEGRNSLLKERFYDQKLSFHEQPLTAREPVSRGQGSASW